MKMELRFTDDVASKVAAGRVAKWHKGEGELVDYGDDLFDFRVEECFIPTLVAEGWAERQNTEHSLFSMQTGKPPRNNVKAAAQQLEQGEVEIQRLHGAAEKVRDRADFFIRVTSSDRGFLRRKVACEGTQLEVDDTVALLSTEPAESIAEGARLEECAGIFRIIGNVFHMPGEELAVAPLRQSGHHFLTLCSDPDGSELIGIYARGGRSMIAAFASAPLIRNVLNGRCCIFREKMFGGRSDVLLQSAERFPESWFLLLTEKLSLARDHFKHPLFDKTISVSGFDGIQEFPKTVVLLSVFPDLMLTCYRARAYGFLYEPQPDSMVSQLKRAQDGDIPETMVWFHENFEFIGRMTVEDFTHHFAELIRVLRARTSARILVFNAPTTSSESTEHRYPSRDSLAVRGLEFNVALAELSRKLDFSIVDVDRIVKRAGIRKQVDWKNLDADLRLAVAREVFHVMVETGVFSKQTAGAAI